MHFVQAEQLANAAAMAQVAAAEQAEVVLQERLMQQEDVYQKLQRDKRDLEHRLANMQVSSGTVV